MTSWVSELQTSIKDARSLLLALDLDPTDFPDLDLFPEFPLRVPLAFVDRMQKGNLDDPLLRQVLSLNQESWVVPGFSEDPLEEHETNFPGILHKYSSRVLVILRGGCAINCRYCFRRHFPYRDQTLTKRSFKHLLAYLNKENAINEVIFSGGDPLMADDSSLGEVIQAVGSLTSIKRIRFHTRLPVVLPNRVTAGLIRVFRDAPVPVILVLHSNHAQEIDKSLSKVVSKLRRVCRSVLNQAVILKGVNDSAQAQISLCETLFDSGIDPYYLNVLDPVSGSHHFAIQPDQISEIYQGMLEALPGFLVPKLVQEKSGVGHKSLWRHPLCRSTGYYI